MSEKKQKTTHVKRRGLSAVTVISLLLVVGSIAAIGVRELLPSHAATTFLQGVYIGCCNQSAVTSYESFLGHKVDIAETFGDGNTSPPGQLPPTAFTFPAWLQSDWTGRRLIYGPGAPFNTAANGAYATCGNQSQQDAFWAKMASGSYDSYVRTLGQNLVSSGHADTVIRMFHEYNGGWFDDCLYNNASEVANFKTTFRNWVNIYRSVAGQRFTIMWNPTYDPANMGTHAAVTNTYPGDDVVDAVGLDVYDRYMSGYNSGFNQTDAARQGAFNNLLTRSDFGLNVWSAFAKSHGKPLDFPEWGLGYGSDYSGGDNPYFINGMAAFFKDPANNVGLESFWEENDCGCNPKGVSAADTGTGRTYPVPRARAAFLAQFGSTANGSGAGAGGTTTVPTPPVVTPVTIPFRMRAGGASYTDPSGNAWTSDANYTSDGSTDTQGTGKITGTTNTALYEDERWANPHIGYKVPIANGTYTVNLHFAEVSPNVTSAGKRVFSGSAEGKTLFSNLDIYKEVGAYKPDDKSFQVTVTDGELDVSLDSTVDAAKLSGLEILPATTETNPPGPTTPPTPTVATGDINADGHVNTLDLSIVLTHDGQNYAPADLNKDGTVGAADLAILLSHWLW